MINFEPLEGVSKGCQINSDIQLVTACENYFCDITGIMTRSDPKFITGENATLEMVTLANKLLILVHTLRFTNFGGH